MQVKALILIFISLLTTVSTPALAYIGPGAGAGTIAVVFGVIISIILALISIIWYPIKRLIKGKKTSNQQDKNVESERE